MAERGLVASLGAVGAAFLASLCCIGPLLFVTLGVGAGLASAFEPLRPIFTVGSVGLLAVGFYVVYGKRPAADAADAPSAAPDGTCAVRRSRTRDKVLLWVATVVALVLLTFPQWSKLLV
jgi:mercuric ion transport protein